MATDEEIIEETEELEKKEEADKGKTTNVLKEPRTIARIMELYEEHKNFTKVTKTINEEFNLNTNPDVIIKVYKRNKKKEFLIDPTNTEFFENSFTETKKRWKEAWDMMSWLVKQVRDFQKMLDTQDKNQRVLMAIKSIPQLTALSKAIIEQLQFLRKETEQIKINQKQFIYSPIQLNLEMKKYKGIFIKEEMNKREKKLKEELENFEDNRLFTKDEVMKLLNKLGEV